MAIKKSELYSTLWKSCDELRGGMDASQYKDYVLVMLFVKYVSDKAKTDPDFMMEIPAGCSFDDFINLKGKSSISWKDGKNYNIGEIINKKIFALAEANGLSGVINVADFSDETKLGKGKDLADTLSNLIGVFQSSGLDFGKNRAGDDDLMGDAYEYLMKNFATESGKSKGQFYTPAEVSRVMAKVIGLDKADSVSKTIYDPTCGSSSLLLRALAETPHGATLYGQEKDSATAGLAKMNMILHGVIDADIRQGDTINNPQHLKAESNTLQTFDYVIANPPFSTKSWLKSAQENDIYGRWNEGTIGVPPEKNGDYAFLLHIIRSMNRHGQGACILPHGVLFRGNGEADIRKYILSQGYIKGIIGLPANLFFGTGIPACIIILDKKDAANRKGIFMIDAKAGFAKDGPKNRLREQDIRRIVDVWTAQENVPHYTRFVTNEEISKNDYNLNIPRYIEAEDTEVLQDIDAHLNGGIPAHDVEQFQLYWAACPNLRDTLFTKKPIRKGYFSLACETNEIRNTIRQHPDFVKQTENFHCHFTRWCMQMRHKLEELSIGAKPKGLIQELGDTILGKFADDVSLVENYDVYEQLLTYWNETMQDDAYLIAADGWKVELYTPQPETKKNKDGTLKAAKEKKAVTPDDIVCDLLPVSIVIDEYFGDMKVLIQTAEERLSENEGKLTELLEEHADDYFEPSNFADEKLNDGNIKKRIKTLNKKADAEEIKILEQYLYFKEEVRATKEALKLLKHKLLLLLTEKYSKLTEKEIKQLVIEKKWFVTLASRLDGEMQRISQNLTTGITALAERYAQTLPKIDAEIIALESKVNAHLQKMGFAWL
ncbi:MAG: type I restriction-modification system subunit M [Prevotellaceae bacterium]|jgi:type I restriction enzyme M protein|nr:type I restriction-modification system subunit M [Prevotellaceae bacterium]